nr:MAG TPA: putative tail fiber protein [Caudoviricetes sp.]
MEYTKNLRLSKPSYDDDVDIQVLNNNMDILDDRVGSLPYLPLKGGTMSGSITLPYNLNKYIGINDTNKIEFNETSFHAVKKHTFSVTSDRFKVNTPSSKEFVVDDGGIYFDGDALIRDLYTLNDEFSGYTKLSTGLLIQWGFVNPSGATPNIQHATFKIPMSSSSYCVVSSRSFYTNSLAGNFEGRWGSATFNFTKTGFDIACAEPKAYGSAEFWIAIGRCK